MSEAASSAASGPGGGTFQPWGSPRKNWTQSAPRAAPRPSGSSRPRWIPIFISTVFDLSTGSGRPFPWLSLCPRSSRGTPRREEQSMRKRVAVVALAAALVFGMTLLAAPGAAASGKVTRLAATLTGGNEVPGPGDPDGRGRAFVTLAGDTACFVLEWSKIGAPLASHIHEGAAGVAGPIVVPFFQPGTNAASLPDTLSSVAGCAPVDPALAGRIAGHPGDFYVNIHTAEFPGGAIRGQLHRSRDFDLDLPRQLSARLNGANEVPEIG